MAQIIHLNFFLYQIFTKKVFHIIHYYFSLKKLCTFLVFTSFYFSMNMSELSSFQFTHVHEWTLGHIFSDFKFMNVSELSSYFWWSWTKIQVHLSSHKKDKIHKNLMVFQQIFSLNCIFTIVISLNCSI